MLGDADLSGTIPAELGALSALKCLSLRYNKLEGSIPPEFRALSSLVNLDLSCNSLSGVIPSTLSNLKNLACLNLALNKKLSDAPHDHPLESKDETQAYLTFIHLPVVLHFINFGIAITKKRQDTLSTSSQPSFAFLANSKDASHPVLSRPVSLLRRDRKNLLKCWKLLGGDEEVLGGGTGTTSRGG